MLSGNIADDLAPLRIRVHLDVEPKPERAGDHKKNTKRMAVNKIPQLVFQMPFERPALVPRCTFL